MATCKIYFTAWLVTAAILSEVRADDEDEGVGSEEAMEQNVLEPMLYLAFLRDSESFDIFCGGSILSNKHILTAASCLQNRDKSTIIVTLENSKYFPTSRIHYIRHEIIPKDFSPPVNEQLLATSDIAILILDNQLEGDDWQAVEIGNEKDILALSIYRFSSYFTVEEHNMFVLPYPTLYFPLGNNEECRHHYEYFTKGWICSFLPSYQKVLVGSPYIYEHGRIPRVIGISLDSEIFRRQGRRIYPIFLTNAVPYRTYIQKILFKSFNEKNLQSESYVN